MESLLGASALAALSSGALVAGVVSRQLRTLRRSLTQAQYDRDFVRGQNEMLQKSYASLERQLANTSLTLVDVRREAELWESSYQRAATQWDACREREGALLADVRQLRAQLAEATKNDARDPKTGRFVKAKPSQQDAH